MSLRSGNVENTQQNLPCPCQFDLSRTAFKVTNTKFSRRCGIYIFNTPNTFYTWLAKKYNAVTSSRT